MSCLGHPHTITSYDIFYMFWLHKRVTDKKRNFVDSKVSGFNICVYTMIFLASYTYACKQEFEPAWSICHTGCSCMETREPKRFVELYIGFLKYFTIVISAILPIYPHGMGSMNCYVSVCVCNYVIKFILRFLKIVKFKTAYPACS